MINTAFVFYYTLCLECSQTYTFLEKLTKLMMQVGKNSFDYLIYHKLIIFNVLKVLLVFKSSLVLSKHSVSSAFRSVNSQVVWSRKWEQVFSRLYYLLWSPEKYIEIYICISIYFRRSSCFPALYDITSVLFKQVLLSVE